MRPQRMRRGEQGPAGNIRPGHTASMRPQRMRRGEPVPNLQPRLEAASLQCGHSACAVENAEKADHEAGVAALQCGHSACAVENQAEIAAAVGVAESFNAATAHAPWRTWSRCS